MPLQLYKIASTEVGSAGATSIDFTSIPQGYTDLLIKINTRSNRALALANHLLQLNGNTSSVYSYRQLYGFSGGTGSANATLAYVPLGNLPGANATSNTFDNTEIYIPNYAGSNYKSISIDNAPENNSSSDWQLNMYAALYSQNTAISSIKIYLSSTDSFVQYSTVTLYGIL